MDIFYTNERNVQIVISLLKYHNIRKIVASPGTTNITLVASLQNDPFFQIYSSVDERSAAYIACGMAEESREPVVLSCTGATASRNYLSGLTEAFYRKIPILAITSTQYEGRIGQMVAQVIDRSSQPLDTCIYHVSLPTINTAEEEWNSEIKANEAFLALKRHGGGPVHINLATTYSMNFSIRELPPCQIIDRIIPHDKFPELPKGKIGIFVGSHSKWTDKQIKAIDSFCHAHNSVVLVDHTSNYHSRFACLFSLIGDQFTVSKKLFTFDLLIHIGNISGVSTPILSNQVWRVNEDGEIRDYYHNLRYVFEMSEESFFQNYSDGESDDSLADNCNDIYKNVYNALPELPFSNVYCAKIISPKIPDNSVVFLGILNSLRCWNFFEWPKTVTGFSNVGGFGIDGDNSAMIGASLVHPNKLYFSIIGDLAFFYDMNVMGNHHIGNNVRILLFNNGKGTEFRNYDHMAAKFSDEEANKYIAAAGHFGNMSRELVKHYVEDLGYEYISASNKEEFENAYPRFLEPYITEKPMLFEVFTDSFDESNALKLTRSSNFNNLETSESLMNAAKKLLKNILGENAINIVRKIQEK